MHIGLRGIVSAAFIVGISSCLGNEYAPQATSDEAGGGIAGTEAQDGVAGSIVVTAPGGGGGVAGGDQALSSTGATAATAAAGDGGRAAFVFDGGGAGSGPGGIGASIGVAGSGGIGASIGVGGSGGTGASIGVGGSPAVAGARPVVYDCGVPAPGLGGIARPTGTPGNLKVLNWAGFKAAATYTFDDANSSQIANYAALKALGVPLTFFLWTSRSQAADPTWARAVLDGHELANHTQSHASTGTGADVDAATAFIEQHFGVKAWTMAAPYGNASYVSLAQTRFLANRGVGSGSIAPNGSNDPYQLPCYLPAQGASASTINSVLDSARNAGAWQIVLVHGFTGGTDGAYQPVAIGEFTASVTHTKAWGDVWIDSMVAVAAYWRAQKMFSSVIPTVSGTDRTWTWTLPAHFPPGKCLRVSVDGGTLKQNGGTLAWNDHGYYNVSLDQGSLTLSSGTDATNTGGAGNTPGGGAGNTPGGATSNASGGASGVESAGAASAGGLDMGSGGTVSQGGSDTGSGGTVSLGGSDAGPGGTVSLGGSDMGSGGTSLAGASGGTSEISATGIIKLSVPLTEEGQDQGFDVYHSSPPLDLSGATVVARLYAPDAVNGQITLWFSCPGGGASAGLTTAFTDLNAGYFDMQATVPAANGAFDPSQIDAVHIEVQATSSGPWQSPATVVYLDTLVSSNGDLNDSFDTSPDASLFIQSTGQSVSGSSFTWLGNYP